MNKELFYNKFTISDEKNIQLHIKNTGIPINYNKISQYEIQLSYEYNDSISQFNIEKGITGYIFNTKYASENSFIRSYKDFSSVFSKWIEQLRIDFNNTFFERKREVVSVSKKFYPVYEEAIMINRLGFEDSSAMIFRKAVEILFKDYLFQYIPEFQDEIRRMTVGSLVYHFYTNELIVKEKFSGHKNKLELIKPLINFINQTFKIGNDFSHYDRKLENLSAKNMEENINKIIMHIVEDVELTELQNKKSDRESDMINYKV